MARRRAEEEQREIALREEAIRQYGAGLGIAYYNYVHGRPETFEEQDQQRTRFVEQFIYRFEGGDHAGKVQSITALLKAVEAKNEPSARLARSTDSRTAPITT